MNNLSFLLTLSYNVRLAFSLFLIFPQQHRILLLGHCCMYFILFCVFVYLICYSKKKRSCELFTLSILGRLATPVEKDSINLSKTLMFPRMQKNQLHSLRYTKDIIDFSGYLRQAWPNAKICKKGSINLQKI